MLKGIDTITIKSPSGLYAIPKTVSHKGSIWEQGPGARTLTDLKKKSFLSPYYRHIIVKAIYEVWPKGSKHPVKEKFYFFYTGERK